MLRPKLAHIAWMDAESGLALEGGMRVDLIERARVILRANDPRVATRVPTGGSREGRHSRLSCAPGPRR